jgi:hypothetical protein
MNRLKIRYLLLFFICASGATAQNLITFQINMRPAIQAHRFDPSAGDSVLLRGSFNAWQRKGPVLHDDDGDSVFTLSYNFGDRTDKEQPYIYVIRKANGREINEQDPDPQHPDNGNRRIILTGEPYRVPVTVFNPARRQADSEFKYSVSALREDFLQLRDSIEAIHPALYTFNNRGAFDRLFASRLADLRMPMTARSFYCLTAPLVVKIGCGHTGLSMPESWWTDQPDRYFPLRLFFADSGVYVFPSSDTIATISPGSEILAINDRPIGEITGLIYSGISADGNNRAYKRAVLNHKFPYLYALFFGFPDSYALRFRNSATMRIMERPVRPASRQQIENQVRTQELSIRELRDQQAAVLRISTFAYYTSDQESHFRTFIDSAFSVLQADNVADLILDIRDNDGGNPFCAAYLLTYLMDEPVPYFDRPFGKYRLLAEPIPPSANRFQGGLYVLIDGGDFSTTGHLCALLKYHGTGIFVGSETGGTYTCNDAEKTVYLKNTGIGVRIAQGTFSVAVEGMDRRHGIYPDYAVYPRIADLIGGKDTVLEYVLKLIR